MNTLEKKPYQDIYRVAKSLGVPRCKKEELIQKIKYLISKNKLINNSINNNKKVDNQLVNISKQSQLQSIPPPSPQPQIPPQPPQQPQLQLQQKQYKDQIKRNNNQQQILIRQRNSNLYNPTKNLPISNISKNESLWWLVFKNREINSRIFSFMQVEAHNYHELNRVEWMIVNNHKQLLIDKVLKNQYLIFPQASNFNDIFSMIFKFINQDNNNNNNNNNNSIDYKVFYKSLFKNYSNYIQNINTKAFYALQFKNLIAVQVLIEDYNFIPNIEMFNHFLKQSSFKVIQFLLKILLQFQQQEQEREQQQPNNTSIQLQKIFDKNEIWKHLYDQHINSLPVSSSSSSSLTSSLSLPYSSTNLLSNSLISSMEIPTIKKRYKVINYLISTLELKSPILSRQQINNLFKICPIEQQFKLKHLIQSCNTIFNLKQYSSKENSKSLLSSSSSSSSKLSLSLSSTSIPIGINSFEDLQDIISQFNQDQLTIRLDEFENEIEKSLIQKMLLFFFNSNNQEKSLRYILHFQSDHYNSLDSIKQFESPSDILALEYGNFELLKRYFDYKIKNESLMIENLVHNNCFINNIIDYDGNSIDNILATTTTTTTTTIKYKLFKYCKSKEKQIKFLQDLINEIRVGNVNLKSKRISPQCLFSLVIGYDYLPFIQLVANELGQMMIPYIYDFNYNNYIRSPLVFSYIYSITIGTIHSTNIYNIIMYGNIELLEHLESLIPDNQFIEISHNKYSNIAQTLPLKSNERFSRTYKYIIGGNIIIDNFSSGDGSGDINTSGSNNNNNHDNNNDNNDKFTKRPNKYLYDSFLFDMVLKSIRINPTHSLKTDQQLIDIKFFIDNTTYDYNPFNPNDTVITLNQIKLFNWILTNRRSDLLQGGRCKISKSQLTQYLYLSGNVNLIWNHCQSPINKHSTLVTTFSPNSTLFFDNSDLLLRSIAVRSDVYTLSMIFDSFFKENYYPSKEEKSSILYLLSVAAQEGSIQIFEYLYLNHPLVLSKKSHKKSLASSWYLQSEIKNQIIFKALSKDHLELVLLLLENFEITPKQFLNNVIPNSICFSFLKDNYK
ncbi:hypothetical protein ACTFIW_005735 [Dictyostelium discoideum]